VAELPSAGFIILLAAPSAGLTLRSKPRSIPSRNYKMFEKNKFLNNDNKE